MQFEREPESDKMTRLHWWFVAAGAASFFATLLMPFNPLMPLLLFLAVFVYSKTLSGEKRQLTFCFLLGGGFLFLGLFAAMFFAGITNGSN
jgi:hypothetical protein